MSAGKKKLSPKPETKTGRPSPTFTKPKQASRLQPKVKQARIRSKKGRGD